ncbi:MAG: hypothetical protein WDM77_06745 [Steroidobacteraceae bacterium]
MAPPRVLIVDQSEQRLPFYRSVLGEFGAEIVVASAAAGITEQVLYEDYALILVNLAAPGSDGPVIVRRLRHGLRIRTTPIVLIGLAGPGPALDGLEGPVDCLAVPVVYEELRTKVRLFVSLHRANAELATQLQAANLSEQRLRREAEELSRLKDEFLSTMSHELRHTAERDFRLDHVAAHRAAGCGHRRAGAGNHRAQCPCSEAHDR